jgi:hypothetical protein
MVRMDAADIRVDRRENKEKDTAADRVDRKVCIRSDRTCYYHAVKRLWM